MQNSRYLKDYPDVLTPEEVMTILGIGKNSTYKLLQTGELKSIKIGKKYRIPKKYLLQYINA
ncbi:MAG: helix-turn-helix domain-containing protein [Lachnospiraceae bacterium]|nr:helix-turn-helix domain-containing protein [Lachnospiraceae bacterium]